MKVICEVFTFFVIALNKVSDKFAHKIFQPLLGDSQFMFFLLLNTVVHCIMRHRSIKHKELQLNTVECSKTHRIAVNHSAL